MKQLFKLLPTHKYFCHGRYASWASSKNYLQVDNYGFEQVVFVQRHEGPRRRVKKTLQRRKVSKPKAKEERGASTDKVPSASSQHPPPLVLLSLTPQAPSHSWRHGESVPGDTVARWISCSQSGNRSCSDPAPVRPVPVDLMQLAPSCTASVDAPGSHRRS